MGHDTEHAGDTQIRTWVPDDQYSVIRELAAARHTSISQIVRDLISAGLQDDAHQQAACDALYAVTDSLEHLKRVAYYTAEAAGLLKISWEANARAQADQKYPNDPESALEAARGTLGKYKKIHFERIRKALKESKSPIEEEE